MCLPAVGVTLAAGACFPRSTLPRFSGPSPNCRGTQGLKVRRSFSVRDYGTVWLPRNVSNRLQNRNKHVQPPPPLSSCYQFFAPSAGPPGFSPLLRLPADSCVQPAPPECTSRPECDLRHFPEITAGWAGPNLSCAPDGGWFLDHGADHVQRPPWQSAPFPRRRMCKGRSLPRRSLHMGARPPEARQREPRPARRRLSGVLELKPSRGGRRGGLSRG